jgi:hypothetical protein
MVLYSLGVFLAVCGVAAGIWCSTILFCSSVGLVLVVVDWRLCGNVRCWCEHAILVH